MSFIIEKIESPYVAGVARGWQNEWGFIARVQERRGLVIGPSRTSAGWSIFGLPRYKENTIVSPKKDKQELVQVRKQGYSIDDEEETIGSRCIGAPS